jgi:hypothetical protein
MIRVIIFFEIFRVVFRVYSLTYFIYFSDLRVFLRKTLSHRVLRRVLIYKIDARGEFLLGGDLIRAVTCEILMEYEYPLI